MKAKELKNLSDIELKEKLAEAEDKYIKLKLSHSVTPLDNPLQIRTQRRFIARILTELRKRELQKENN